jgi:hypothetical protein
VGRTISITAVGNGRLVAALRGRALQAEGLTVGKEDLYDVVDRGSGLVNLRSHETGLLVGVDGQGQLHATFDADRAEARFRWVAGGGADFSLRSTANDLLVASFDGRPLRAEGRTIGVEDRYTFRVH